MSHPLSQGVHPWPLPERRTLGLWSQVNRLEIPLDETSQQTEVSFFSLSLRPRVKVFDLRLCFAFDDSIHTEPSQWFLRSTLRYRSPLVVNSFGFLFSWSFSVWVMYLYKIVNKKISYKFYGSVLKSITFIKWTPLIFPMNFSSSFLGLPQTLLLTRRGDWKKKLEFTISPTNTSEKRLVKDPTFF